MSGEKYKILRSLNMAGTVTLVESAADGRKYVLKELTEESLPIYRRISELPPQESLMQVHEIFKQDGNITAVCEFAKGKPLDELLDSGRMFPIAEIRQITAQLCRAAEHLHQHGIIHRDITPKNIILDENLNLKLIDFDIARQYSGNREQDTTLYGTEGFAPPEQYGFRETRFTADIYAIGMVLKLLLNGCPDCSPAQEVLLRKIATKCTRFVPEKRYRSVGAVRRAVSRSCWIISVGISAASAAVLSGIIAAVLILQNVSMDVPQISEVQQLPESSFAETIASNTAKPTTTAVTEPPKPQELHTSDMDNPNKITVTTERNERGYYEDVCDYVFYDDPAVHGEWGYCSTIPTEALTPLITSNYIKNHKSSGENIFSALTFSDNGEARCILSDGEEMPCDSRWTNGFLICEYVEGTAAQRLFEATIDGEEFLFVAVKTGDFSRENRVDYYEVYTRAE
ncbi:MAG: serine/threonine protein kinase [Oscillospiraceae bacterium]